MLGQMKTKALKFTMLTTTCFFHAGGFNSPFRIMLSRVTIVFNHGGDIDNGDTSEIIYKEVDQFKPVYMICGSHHMVLLSKQKPKNKTLDLRSVWFVLPMGSTVPNTLYEDLKHSLTSLGM